MLKKSTSCVCDVAISLSKSDGAVVVNSPSAHFVTTVTTDVALALRSDRLGSISTFSPFGRLVQLNKGHDGLLYSTGNGFFLSSQCPRVSNFQLHNYFGDQVRGVLFRKAKESDQLISAVTTEQTRQSLQI